MEPVKDLVCYPMGRTFECYLPLSRQRYDVGVVDVEMWSFDPEQELNTVYGAGIQHKELMEDDNFDYERVLDIEGNKKMRFFTKEGYRLLCERVPQAVIIRTSRGKLELDGLFCKVVSDFPNIDVGRLKWK